ARTPLAVSDEAADGRMPHQEEGSVVCGSREPSRPSLIMATTAAPPPARTSRVTLVGARMPAGRGLPLPGPDGTGAA
ncbi:hypothetical protein, partial [Frankia casuarinae]|uniref:hypothetical protein n=1 Tax=Frankia casuarinae (strain DSM 45818 / CECT 9043 / HFP020203 / CcI3) TaxID=106370 RepID=UPI001F22C06E